VIWDLYQQYRIHQLDLKLDRVQTAAAEDSVGQRAVARLEGKVDRLALICRAMFELMQASSGVPEERLKAKILEIDLRDGSADGSVSPQQKRCPKCDAMMSPQFGRCLFCGHQDESAPAFR